MKKVFVIALSSLVTMLTGCFEEPVANVEARLFAQQSIGTYIPARMEIMATEDNVVIKSVKVNRGYCAYRYSNGWSLNSNDPTARERFRSSKEENVKKLKDPVPLMYGEKLDLWFSSNGCTYKDISDVTVVTNNGEFTMKWERS